MQLPFSLLATQYRRMKHLSGVMNGDRESLKKLVMLADKRAQEQVLEQRKLAGGFEGERRGRVLSPTCSAFNMCPFFVQADIQRGTDQGLTGIVYQAGDLLRLGGRLLQGAGFPIRALAGCPTAEGRPSQTLIWRGPISAPSQG